MGLKQTNLRGCGQDAAGTECDQCQDLWKKATKLQVP